LVKVGRAFGCFHGSSAIERIATCTPIDSRCERCLFYCVEKWETFSQRKVGTFSDGKAKTTAFVNATFAGDPLDGLDLETEVMAFIGGRAFGFPVYARSDARLSTHDPQNCSIPVSYLARFVPEINVLVYTSLHSLWVVLG